MNSQNFDLIVFDFCNWLAGTPVSLFIQNQLWIIPTVQSTHILAVAVVMASGWLIGFRMMGLSGRSHSIHGMANRFLPWIWSALLVLAVSGVLLVVGEPARQLLNVAFRLKMLLVAALAAATYVFQKALTRNPANWDAQGDPAMAVKSVGALSLFVLLAIAVAGRWIAYVEMIEVPTAMAGR